MQLYCGNTKQFVEDVIFNRVAGELERAFKTYFGYPASISESHSWRNSLDKLAHQINYSRLLDHGIILEMRLPLSSARLDCLLAGMDSCGKEQSVIIELKQWSQVEPSDVDGCVVTPMGGHPVTTAHPSLQASRYKEYLANTTSAFSASEGAIALSSCAYLHNMVYDPLSPIYDRSFGALLASTPAFAANQAPELSLFLRDRLSGGAGAGVLEKIVNSRYQPSKKLLEHTAAIIQGNPAYTLIDEQIVAFNTIMTYARRGLRAKQKAIILINGGPGTGKSLIALNVMAELSRHGINAQYATGSRAFTGNLRKSVGTKAGIQFLYFNSYSEADPDAIDVLIMDEAHRIRESSDSRFTRRDKRSGKNQVDELIDASRVSVFFIDDAQAVRPGEVGSSDLISAAAARYGVKLVRAELKTQFRCAGSDRFVSWIDELLGIGEARKPENATYERDEDFDFQVFDSPAAMESAIRSKVDEGNSGRLVAGFCWPWSNARSDGTLVDDVVVGEWHRPWNAKPEANRLAKGIPRAQFWPTDQGGIDQVGCIYTAQGFEFDYVGVIVGKDLTWDSVGRCWVGHKERSYDSVVKRSASSSFVNYAKSTYRVLFTRGMKGCYAFFEDDATRRLFEDRTS